MEPFVEFVTKHPEYTEQSFVVLYRHLQPNLLPLASDLNFLDTHLDGIVGTGTALNAICSLSSSFPALRAELVAEWWSVICAWAAIFAHSALLMTPQTHWSARMVVIHALYSIFILASTGDGTQTVDIAEPLLGLWLGTGRDPLIRKTVEAVNSDWHLSIKVNIMIIVSTVQGAPKSLELPLARLSSLINDNPRVYFEAALSHVRFDAQLLDKGHPEDSEIHPYRHIASLSILSSLCNIREPDMPDLIVTKYPDITPVATMGLVYLGRHSPDARKGPLVMGLATMCLVFVERACETSNGCKWLVHAINHGLLESIAGLSFWLTAEPVKAVIQPQHVYLKERVDSIISEQLGRYLSYPEVVRAATRVFLKHADSPAFVQMQQHIPWKSFKTLAMEYRRLAMSERCQSELVR